MEEELIVLVNLALDDLYENDQYLLKVKAHERDIVAHFSRYFINRLENNDNFNKYNVDCEYNRDEFNEKKYKEIIYDKKKHRIIPDMIMHQRGSNSNNILAIEFKTYFSKDKNDKNDRLKLEALTNNDSFYRYRMGLHIILGETREKVNIVKYINGKKQIKILSK